MQPALPLPGEQVHFDDLSLSTLLVAANVVAGSVVGAVEGLGAVLVDEDLLVAGTLAQGVHSGEIAVSF